jgi:predicted esterase
MIQTNPHLQQRVEHYGPLIHEARIVVVLVHGRTITPEYMYEHVVLPLALEDVAFVAPAAADNSWYPKGFLLPIVENQPGIDHTMELFDQVVGGLLDTGVSAQQLVLCGFSQGACAASQYASLHPRRWGGLIAFTGGLIGPPGTNWNITGNFDGMPAYFSTSDIDPFVPEFRVSESVAIFKAAGAEVNFDLIIGREHEVSPTEISRAKALVLSTN